LTGPQASLDAVVVGAGMGGLMAAALLANRGRRVVVAEASERIGGYQCRIAPQGLQLEPHFHFLQDASPGRPVRKLLDELGIELEWKRVDPLVDYHFPDRRVTVPAKRAEFIERLKCEFPQEVAGIDRLFATTGAIYDAAQGPPRISPVLVRYGADTVADLVGRYLRDPRLRTIAGGWAAYFGYGAAQISGAAIAVFTESCFDGGVLQPVGGIKALADALAGAVHQHGGEIRCCAPVERIDCRDGRARGVVLACGERLEASAVISAADSITTLRDLTDDPRARALAGRVERLERFRSPFSVYLAVRSPPAALLDSSPVKVVFPSYDTVAQDRAQLAGEVERAPVSLGIPTMMNPQLAPDGVESVLLYTFLDRARIDRLVSNEADADAFARRLLATADRALPGLASSATAITHSAAAIPEIYRNGTAGALGFSPHPDTLLGSPRVAQMLRHRLGNAVAMTGVHLAPRTVTRLSSRSPIPGPRTPVPGLFLCGQWTNTGPGVNNVFVSSARAVDAITGNLPRRVTS
jgi:phytoene dehydrogenase-like protein